MKKRDVWLILIIAAAAVVIAGVHFLVNRENAAADSGGLYAVARVDGSEWGRWRLDQNREIDIDTKYGHNQLTIRDGYALMTEADCPDRYCMEMGKASRVGNTIVCLPHRLVIEIVNENNDSDSESTGSVLTPDAVTK